MKRKRRNQAIRGCFVVLGILGLAACDEHIGCAPVLTTNAGQLELHDEEVTVGACQRLRAAAPMLVGTRFCPRLECGEDAVGCEIDDDGNKVPSDEVLACHDTQLEGPAEHDGTCVTFTDAGFVTWSFSPASCETLGYGYSPNPDTIMLEAVAADVATARLVPPGDAWALRSVDPGPADAFPADAQLAAGEVAHVVADEVVHLAVVLERDGSEAIGWNPQDANLNVEDVAGAGGTAELLERGVVRVTLPAAAELDLSVSIGEDELAVGQVRGVAIGDLASLEVIVGYNPEDEDRWSVPVGARAVLRTSEGTVVYGAPVQWEVIDGRLPVWRDAELAWDADYVALMDRDGKGCHKPPLETTEYRAAVLARFGDLEHTAELRWTEQDEGFIWNDLAARKGWEEDPACQGPGFDEGCGCRAGGSRDTAIAWFGLGIVMAFVRKRPRR